MDDNPTNPEDAPNDPFVVPEPISGPDEEANDAKLQAELKSYHTAMEEEFETGVKYKEGTLTPLEIRDRTEELLTQAIPSAVARMKYLVNHGASESLQFNAAKYILDRGLGKDGAAIGDPLQALLQSLRKKDTVTSGD